MTPTSFPVALITGASSGIGEAAAKEFARHGYRLALAARRRERLEALAEEIRAAGGEALVVPVDVSDLESVKRMVQTTLETWGQIDVLINNAGFGRLRRLENQHPVDDIEAQVRVNLLGAMWAARAVLPHMYRRGSGSIVNVSSIAAWVAMPGYSVYAATKYALRGFTEGLRREAASRGVHVAAIYPGPVDTEFNQHIGTTRPNSNVFPRWMTLSAEQTAQVIYRLATGRRHSRLIPGSFAFLAWVNHHLPFVAELMSRRRTSSRKKKASSPGHS